MALLDGALAGIFGAALAGVFADGMLHKITMVDDGAGGFKTTGSDHPLKLSLEGIGMEEKATAGLPSSAVRLTVLRAGLSVTIDLDDAVSADGMQIRVISVETDPAAAAYRLVGVPT